VVKRIADAAGGQDGGDGEAVGVDGCASFRRWRQRAGDWYRPGLSLLKVVDSTETRVCSSVFMATGRLPSQSRKRNRYSTDGIFRRDRGENRAPILADGC
jgi:hypothetical protein